ncbi:UBX domain-containing protein [Entamoeba marina]
MQTKLSFDPAETKFQIKRSKGFRCFEYEPDSFFELTPQEAIELSTPAPRDIRLRPRPSDEERLQKLKEKTTTTLKFRLPDGTEILRNFKPTMPTRVVYEFIEEVCVQMKFRLRKSFGKDTWINRDETPLYEVGLVPSCVLCVVISPEHNPQPPFVKQEIIEAFK